MLRKFLIDSETNFIARETYDHWQSGDVFYRACSNKQIPIHKEHAIFTRCRRISMNGEPVLPSPQTSETFGTSVASMITDEDVSPSPSHLDLTGASISQEIRQDAEGMLPNISHDCITPIPTNKPSYHYTVHRLTNF